MLTLFAVYVISRSYFQEEPPAMSTISLLVVLSIFVVFCKFKMTDSTLAYSALVFSIVALNLLTWSFVVFSSENLLFVIEKIFQNTGLYAVFLAICCSILIPGISTKDTRSNLILFFLFLSLIVIVWLRSRTAILMMLINILYLPKQYFHFLGKKSLWFGSLAILFISLMALKRDSSHGRFLIWKISCNIIRDSPLIGTGLNSYKSIYPTYQAKFYQQGKMTDKEILLADNTIYAFNEYIQLTCETGLVGLVFLLALVFLYLSNKNRKKNPLFIAGVTLLISFLFTYSLHTPYFVVIAVLLLCFFSTTTRTVIRIQYPNARYLYGALCIVVLLIAHTFCYKLYAFNQFISLHEKPSVEITSECKKIERYLSDNPSFLYVFSQNLYSQGKYKEALKRTSSLAKLIQNTDVNILQGGIHESLGAISKAEEYFKNASNICPNRFVPRYELMKLYIETGQDNLAKQTAKEIIKLPEKIPSAITLAIKMEAESYLKQCEYEKTN